MGGGRASYCYLSIATSQIIPKQWLKTAIIVLLYFTVFMGWEFEKGLVGSASPHVVEIRKRLKEEQQGEAAAGAGWHLSLSLFMSFHELSLRSLHVG